jgi:COMPASS component SWD3
MDPSGVDDSSTDDDAESQTTEDDPQLPENSESAPVPSGPSGLSQPPKPAAPTQVPAAVLSIRERPHYEPRHVLRGHTKSISAVKFSPDGTLLASCG